MLLLVLASNSDRFKSLVEGASGAGIQFWSAVYIPIVVAMAPRQNVVAAFEVGMLAVVAGVAAVIEGTLLSHEAAAECAVIGVKDETWGESVMAFIGLKGGATLEYSDLKSLCNGKMSSYKIPKAIEIVDALPRNAMGKLTKPELKKLL